MSRGCLGRGCVCVCATEISRVVVLLAFLTAAGYASANVLYHFGDPEYVHQGFTVAPFQVGHSSRWL